MAYLRLENGTVVDEDAPCVKRLKSGKCVMRYPYGVEGPFEVEKTIEEFDETTEEFIDFVDCFILVINGSVYPFDKDLEALESLAMKYVDPKIYGAVQYFDEYGLPAMRCVIQLNIDGKEGIWEVLSSNYKVE